MFGLPDALLATLLLTSMIDGMHKMQSKSWMVRMDGEWSFHIILEVEVVGPVEGVEVDLEALI